MSKKEILKTVIENNGGIAKTSDFAANGINKYEVAAFCKEGVIERIRRGFYQLPQSKSITEEQLIRELLPQGIICVESALFHHGYSDFSPREWSIAVPRTASRAVKNIEEFPMKAYYIQKEFLDIGKSISNFNGVILPVYDRERTICDCFKYRTKLDNEIFNKAVNAYAADDAVRVAHENVEENHVEDAVKVMQGDLTKGVDFKADVIVANLMADLVMLLSEDARKHLTEDGIFISSGILVEKEKMVSAAIREAGFRIVEIAEDGEWCAIAAVPEV